MQAAQIFSEIGNATKADEARKAAELAEKYAPVYAKYKEGISKYDTKKYDEAKNCSKKQILFLFSLTANLRKKLKLGLKKVQPF